MTKRSKDDRYAEAVERNLGNINTKKYTANPDRTYTVNQVKTCMGIRKDDHRFDSELKQKLNME